MPSEARYLKYVDADAWRSHHEEQMQNLGTGNVENRTSETYLSWRRLLPIGGDVAESGLECQDLRSCTTEYLNQR
jgi:hypothetical protein